MRKLTTTICREPLAEIIASALGSSQVSADAIGLDETGRILI